MNDKASHILYLLLFFSGWIGIFWAVYAFFLNAYNGTTEVITENPSFFTLFCVSLISIATAFILERTVQTKE
jgi:hypothetical protein